MVTVRLKPAGKCDLCSVTDNPQRTRTLGGSVFGLMSAGPRGRNGIRSDHPASILQVNQRQTRHKYQYIVEPDVIDCHATTGFPRTGTNDPSD